jgi:hypothetical protein
MIDQENAEWEQKARDWIETVGGFKLGNDTLQHELKNGVALCKYGTIPYHSLYHTMKYDDLIANYSSCL